MSGLFSDLVFEVLLEILGFDELGGRGPGIFDGDLRGEATGDTTPFRPCEYYL